MTKIPTGATTLPVRRLKPPPPRSVPRTREELLLDIVGRIRSGEWQPGAPAELAAATAFTFEEIATVEAEAREIAERPDPRSAA